MIEEDQNECNTRHTFAYLTITILTADSDQNSTVSESDVDYDSGLCNASDFDGYCTDNRDQPPRVVLPPLH